MIELGDIERAAECLDGVAIVTPLLESAALNEAVNGRVLLKPECLQRTGSFKIRGAYNLMSRLSPEQARRGVVGWSSGNHAQGVACAGGLLGISAAIVMPEDAPQAKIDRTRHYGGEVISYDRYSEDREVIARELAAERGAELVPSYDHDDIIAGQGTVGLEIAEQLRQRKLQPDQVLIPCGGGGLSAGCATALKAHFPQFDLYAVEPRDFDDTARSFAAGERLRNSSDARSICDALQTESPGALTFAIHQALGSRALLVSDADVRAAMRFAFQELKLVVEPGGAVALAALLAGKLDASDRISVVVLSGGNVDGALFAEIQSSAI